jgi:carboxymethylenebutenolidase
MLVDYYFSLASPWAYLGSARIESIAARHGAELRPWVVDFSLIFPASGGLPLAKRAPQRQAYRLMELRRWREYLGVPLVLQPAAFPMDEALIAAAVLALREERGGAAAIRLSHRIMRALWAEDRNPADRDCFLALAGECGEAGAALLSAAPRFLDQRRADSEAALARGVFGAPSFVIGEEIFWGQDRLDFVDRRLAEG